MMHPSRQAYVEENDENDDEPGVDLANIPIDRDYAIPSTAASGVAPEKASAILAQMSRKRRAAAIAVPTDDGKVRQQLRSLGEPITLFGEGPGDRRDRLRELLTQKAELEAGSDEEGDFVMGDAQPQQDEAEEQDEEFYTEGIPALLESRKDIARYSLPRAQSRVAYQKLLSKIPLRTHVKQRKAIKSHLSTFDLLGTQIAGERPTSLVRFSPQGDVIAAGSWSGSLKLFSVPDLNPQITLRGHTDRVGGISWSPHPPTSPDTMALASGGGEGNIHLWSTTKDTPLSTLTGHTARVCRVEFHPSGKYLASASFDTTWRLWDIPTANPLLLQEGHSREVYAVSFNPDGSLLATGGLDSIGRVWDLRTGRTVMILDGHSKDIYALDWAPDGHRVLSGAGDGFVKCWDIRSVGLVGNIGANLGGVTDLRWFKGGSEGGGGGAVDTVMKDESGALTGSVAEDVKPQTAGTFFVSGGFDKNVQIFSGDDWALAKTLKGHSGNVLGVDVERGGRYVASCGHDRTVKLWGRDDGVGVGEVVD